MIFFTGRCVSSSWIIFSTDAHKTNFSVNYLYFALDSHQEMNDSWGTLIIHLFESPKKKYFCEIKKIFATSYSNNAKLIFMEKKSRQ